MRRVTIVRGGVAHLWILAMVLGAGVASCADTPSTTPDTDGGVADGRDAEVDGTLDADGGTESDAPDGTLDQDVPPEPGGLLLTGSVVAGGGAASGDRFTMRAYIAVPPQPTRLSAGAFRIEVGGTAASGGQP